MLKKEKKSIKKTKVSHLIYNNYEFYCLHKTKGWLKKMSIKSKIFNVVLVVKRTESKWQLLYKVKT